MAKTYILYAMFSTKDVEDPSMGESVYYSNLDALRINLKDKLESYSKYHRAAVNLLRIRLDVSDDYSLQDVICDALNGNFHSDMLGAYRVHSKTTVVETRRWNPMVETEIDIPAEWLVKELEHDSGDY